MQSNFNGGPDFLAFAVTFGLVVAGIFLFRSLSKHLRKVKAQEAAELRAAQAARETQEAQQDAVATPASSPEASDHAEGGEAGGDQVAEEPGDRQ